MVKYEEKDFIKGDRNDICDALLISEECNSYIDSVLEKIYELNLTPEEEKELGLKIQRDKYDDSWKRVVFSFEPGNEVALSRWKRLYTDGELTYLSHEITCNGQLDTDRLISALSGFGIIGSHTLFSYSDEFRVSSFNEGDETKIKISDQDGKLTQYIKTGVKQKIEIEDTYGTGYHTTYLDSDACKRENRMVDGKYQSFYYDLDGNPLTQPELVATTFDSFNDAYASFTDKFRRCRDILDNRIEEIIEKKNQSNK